MINYIQDTAVEEMMAGIESVAKLLRNTFGGAGTAVIVEDTRRPYHKVINDCEQIIQALYIKDNDAQRIALDFLKELCDKQDKTAGNGRKTAILMGIEILKGVFGKPRAKAELINLKEELDALIPYVESEIDKRTTKITVDNVQGVATTASRNKETGRLLQEIYKQIGPQGILTIEGSKTYETSYKITDGVRFELTGMLSPEMVHDEDAKKENRKETKAVYENPLILVTKKKINHEDDINPLLREIGFSNLGEHKPLVIFTNDMDSNVASMLVNLHKNGTNTFDGFSTQNVLIIKAPSLWQDYIFEDFAKCVGATIIEDKTGLNLKNMKLEHLGTCGKIEVDQEDTIITGIKDISQHVKSLYEKGDDDSLLRLSWLASKSALLKLGSNSQSDLSYKRLKANDANRSTYLALQYGVVPGGAKCLYDIGKDSVYLHGEEITTEASKILSQALQAPMRQAMENYGKDYEDYLELITEDVVDASETVKKAVRNAVGIASTLITAPAIVYIPKKTPEEIAYEVATKQSNPFGQ